MDCPYKLRWIIEMLSFRTTGFNGYGIQYSPFFDNKLAVSTASNYGLVGNGKIFILSIEPNGQIRNDIAWDTQDGVFDLAWSEIHENQVIGATGDGSIKLFDLTVPSFPVMNFKEHSKEVFSVNWNLVDKTNFVSSSWDGTIKVWSPLRSGSMLTLHTASHNHERLEMVPAPQGLVAPNEANRGTKPSINTANCVYSSLFSPHSPHLIASCNGSSHVQVWDIRSPSPLQLDFVAHGGLEALTCDWNKYKSTIIASAGTDKRIRIWDMRMITKIDQPNSYRPMPSYHLRGPSPLNELLGHDFAIRKILWSPHNSQELASASYDTTCRIWRDESNERARFLNSGNGGCVGIMNRHKEFVIGCDYSLWGEPGWVASTGWDEMVYVWDSKRLVR